MFVFCCGPLKDLPTKTRTQQFSGVSSSRCSHTFRALFNHSKFIFHVLYVHLTLISAPCWQAKTDSPVNEGREHCMGNSNSWDVTASSPSSSRCCHENALGEFACRLQSGTQSRLLYLFHTHVSWLRIPSINSPHLTFVIIIISTTNYIFKVNESVINMFYTLIHVKYN